MMPGTYFQMFFLNKKRVCVCVCMCVSIHYTQTEKENVQNVEQLVNLGEGSMGGHYTSFCTFL